MKRLVAVPVYNEAPTLKRILHEIKKFHSGDIVVIDDGSTDGSDRIISSIKGLKVISHGKNLGYGQSLIDGFNYSVANGYQLLTTIDCDEQHEPSMIPEMFAGIGSYDVLSGSRYLDRSADSGATPPDRKRINMIMTEAINQVTGYNLTDSFCGFKCYRVSSLSRLKLDEPGYAQPVQFWIQAKHFELSVMEIPVPRIYKNLDRKFGGELDDPRRRLEYYKRIMNKEIRKWSMSWSSALIQTI